MANHTSEKGSEIAKSGFKNEHIIVEKFNKYKEDIDAQNWLKFLEYDIDKIESLEAFQIPANSKIEDSILLPLDGVIGNLRYKKADAQVQLRIIMNDTLYFENFSIKKTSKKSNFGQIDKRKVETYSDMWKMTDQEIKLFSLFTGALNPLENGYSESTLKDIRRVGASEFMVNDLEKMLCFLNDRKINVLSDILIGRGGFAAQYMIISDYTDKNNIEYHIIKTMDIINYLSKFDFIQKTPKANTLSIGNIVTVQRKGGTPDPDSLQFKFAPLSAVNVLNEK